MRADLRRRIAGAFPPIARRDAQIARLWGRVRSLRRTVEARERDLHTLTELRERDLEEKEALLRELRQVRRDEANLRVALESRKAADRSASFQRRMRDSRRLVLALRELDPDLWHPWRKVPFKLRNHRLAASHGLQVPQVLRVWADASAIDLAGLPDEFVLKSDGGSGGHGVMALVRRGHHFSRVGTKERMTAEEVREYFTDREEKEVFPPFFAEEMLHGRGRTSPIDVKVYGFYGEIGQILLRGLAADLDPLSATYRYLDPSGHDLGSVARDREVDPRIPGPEDLAGVLEVAQHLSRAVGLAMCRIDMYETDRGIVVGEITRLPGGPQRYDKEHDVSLGLLWERAQLALELDLARGRPFGVLHGDVPAPDHYPEGHPSRAGVGSWAVVQAPCKQWCVATDAAGGPRGS